MPLADRALVVGINVYPGIGPLSGAENDANDFYDWVVDPKGGNVAKENAKKILSTDFPKPGGVADARPAEEEFRAFFSGINSASRQNNTDGIGLKAGNRLWLFFSGHGFAPSLDRSGVLMANATLDEVHNVAAMLWANRLHEGGWFDDVLLFQDACRSRVADGDLTPPFLRPRQAPNGQLRRRFYAFSAKNKKLSKELPFPAGARGVFTLTLLQGLRGQARDPKTGAVTTSQLKAYLQDNMKTYLSKADLEDDDIAKEPEVYDPDPFDIVPAPPAAAGAPGGAPAVAPAAVPDFPVRISISQPNRRARIENGSFVTVDSADPAPQDWPVRRLPRGIYKLIVDGIGESLFQVAGMLNPDGTEREEHVRI